MESPIKNVFDVAMRSLSAQQVRMNTIASNIANAGAKSGSPKEAYRAIRPVFETLVSDSWNDLGLSAVGIKEIQALNRDPVKLYEPNHPNADKDGYVYQAAVDQEEELIELLEASRQYQNNLEVISTLRNVMIRTIDIGK